ncbi:MAG: GPP34 family phosphoprotein [Hyphomicrobiales bacterium]
MELNIAEKYLLLIQHPIKSKFIVENPVKGLGLVGSILLDLTDSGCLEIENKRFIVKSADSNLSPVHLDVLQQIAKSKKARTVKSWINKFSKRSKRYQKAILQGLKDKDLIKIHNKSFLWIKYYNTQITDIKIREGIINDLREIIFNDKKASEKDIMTLAIIKACNLHKIIAKSKEEKNVCKKKLKEIMQSDLVTNGVSQIIKETQAALVLVIAGAVIVTSAGSN